MAYRRLYPQSISFPWAHDMIKLYYLLAVKAAMGIESGLENIRAAAPDGLLAEILKEIDEGKTPVSNTQVCKVLQTVVNEILGEGFKVINRDVEFLMETYTQLGSEKLTVKMLKLGQIKGIVTQLVHRVLTNGTLNLTGLGNKNKSASVPVADKSVIATPKAEKSKNKAPAQKKSPKAATPKAANTKIKTGAIAEKSAA